MTRRPRRAPQLAALVAAMLYGWAVAGTRSFTLPATVLTAIGVVVVLAVGAARTGARQPFRAWLAAARDACSRATRSRTRPREALGATGWTLVIGLIVGWELLNLFSLPRADHPTISSLIDTLTASRLGRFALFLLWLALGVGVLRR